MARVLIVDDTAPIRFLIRMNLELMGYQVAEAVDGQDCLEQLEAAEAEGLVPDAVTMDLMMPRLNGVTAVERIRADKRFDDMAIIMVTTQQQQFDVSRAVRAGVDGYVTKPFTPDDLVVEVGRAVESRRQR